MRSKAKIMYITGAAMLVLIIGACASESSDISDSTNYENPKVLADLIAAGEPEYLLVDVRTPAEFHSGHIPTAVNIPVSEIETRPIDVAKQKLVIVYCRSGSRSNRAAGILESLGYTRVVDFGGIYRWEGELERKE